VRCHLNPDPLPPDMPLPGYEEGQFCFTHGLKVCCSPLLIAGLLVLCWSIPRIYVGGGVAFEGISN